MLCTHLPLSPPRLLLLARVAVAELLLGTNVAAVANPWWLVMDGNFLKANPGAVRRYSRRCVWCGRQDQGGARWRGLPAPWAPLIPMR